MRIGEQAMAVTEENTIWAHRRTQTTSVHVLGSMTQMKIQQVYTLAKQ
jgi:hypothetical protein